MKRTVLLDFDFVVGQAVSPVTAGRKPASSGSTFHAVRRFRLPISSALPTWSRLLACHDGFRAGVRPGPAVIYGLWPPVQSGQDIFDVPAHTLKFAFISYPMIIVAQATNLWRANLRWVGVTAASSPAQNKAAFGFGSAALWGSFASCAPISSALPERGCSV